MAYPRRASFCFPSSLLFLFQSFLLFSLLLSLSDRPNYIFVNGLTPVATKEFEKKFEEVFNLLVKDPESFKAAFADNGHEIKLCYNGMSECLVGTVDTVFQPYIEAAKHFYVKGSYMSSIDEKGGFATNFISLETKDGCKARISNSVYNEFNDEMKIVKHYAYSDDSKILLDCLEKYFNNNNNNNKQDEEEETKKEEGTTNSETVDANKEEL